MCIIMFMLLNFFFLCSALQVIMYYLPLFCLFLELRLLIILFLVSTNFSFITNLVNSFYIFFRVDIFYITTYK